MEVASDMLKCSGEAGVRWVTDLCNAIVSMGVMYKDWRKSWMLSTYIGKGDVLDCGSHRGIKLIDHVLKVLERLVEKKVKSKGTLDSTVCSLDLLRENRQRRPYSSRGRCKRNT